MKPNNCYLFDDAWVLSDFGLIDIPEGEPLTVGAQALGPRNFIAPEMVLRPELADGALADVYSLGKTLWVLASGQAIPPPGEHRPELQRGLVDFGVAHPRTHFLDRLIEQTSVDLPSQRPPMTAVAQSLRQWSRHPAQYGDTTPPILQVDDISAEISVVFRRDQRGRDLRAQRSEAVARVASYFEPTLTQFLNPLINSGVPCNGIDTDHSGISEPLAEVSHQIAGEVSAFRRIAVQRNVGDNRPGFLTIGVGVVMSADGRMLAAATQRVMGSGTPYLWSATTEVFLLDSVDQEVWVRELSQSLIEHFPAALRAFRDAIMG